MHIFYSLYSENQDAFPIRECVTRAFLLMSNNIVIMPVTNILWEIKTTFLSNIVT